MNTLRHPIPVEFTLGVSDIVIDHVTNHVCFIGVINS